MSNDDSDSSFPDIDQETINGEGDSETDEEENPFTQPNNGGQDYSGDEIPTWKLVIGLAGFIFGLFLSITFSLNGNGEMGLIILVSTFIAPFVLTKGGRDILKEMSEEIEKSNQRQDDSSGVKSNRICSDCGWQNPQSNNFCHDCGIKLTEEG